MIKFGKMDCLSRSPAEEGTEHNFDAADKGYTAQ